MQLLKYITQLSLGDKIVSTLGTDPAVISAAAGVVAAEQNFNPFNVDIPSICGNASLPATQQLRGIVPLVDPAVGGSAVENANSATSKKTPFDATGLSVAQVMQAQGFSNFTTVDSNGDKTAPGAAASNSTASTAAVDSASASGSSGASGSSASSGSSCSKTKSKSKSKSKSSKSNSNTNTAAASNSTAASASAASSNSTTGATTDLAGVDYGKCTPTMSFVFGRPGRKATEGTFLPTDPLVAQGQQDALNPNIITNEICNQLTNVCDANQAAKNVCASAKALVESLGTKNQSTADAFNQALGF